MMADGSGIECSFVPDPGNAMAFRGALGQFVTGVTLVTIAGPDGPMGFTANSFSSLSLDPPLVLWSLARSSRRFAHFAEATDFAIHVLGQEQADWPARFGVNGPWANPPDRHTPEGVPVLPGALARFDCRQYAAHDGGDHLIIVGLVRRVTLEEGQPLVFANGRFGGLAA
jgi:flavin reductase (DIM6/NTAB) family NADH-FMN oxidoreductase RutF